MSISRPRRLAALMASLAVTMTLVQPAIPASAAEDSDVCPAVTVVAARGSSQTKYENLQNPAEWETDGWEGETLHKLFRHTHNYSWDKYGESIFDRNNVDFLEISANYPAQEVTDFSLLVDNTEEQHPTRDGFLNALKNWAGTLENSANYAFDFANASLGVPHAVASTVRSGFRLTLDKTKLSADIGTRAALDQINAHEKKLGTDCSTQYLLAGYSQGAMALTPLVNVLDKRNQLAGVVSLGNPYLKSGPLEQSGGERIGTSTNQGIYASLFYKNAFSSPITYWTDKNEIDGAYITDDITEYCVGFDMMCDHSPDSLAAGLANQGGLHTQYYLNGKYYERTEASTRAERDRVAQRIIDAVSIHLPGQFGNPATGGDGTGGITHRASLETMFVIDTTGSMSDDIQATVQQVDTIANKLLGSNPESRIGLVEYRGPGEFRDGTNNAAYTRLPLSRDIEAFRAELQNMADTSGGREYVNTGILTALQQDWNPGVSRSIIVIGDEPGDDHHLAEEVQRQLLELDKDKLLNLDLNLEGANAGTRTLAAPTAAPQAQLGEASVHVITNDTRTADRLRGLAEANNGRVFTYSDADIADSLLAALDEITDRPVAGLVVPEMSLTGEPQHLSAQLSRVYAEGPVEMILDLGDGRILTLDESRSADVVYDQPGLYEVKLTVTDSRGRQDTDVRYVAVETEEAYAAALDRITPELVEMFSALPEGDSTEPTAPSRPGRGSSGLSSR